MKKIKRNRFGGVMKALAAVAVIAFSGAAHALIRSQTVDGIKWYYEVVDGQARIFKDANTAAVELNGARSVNIPGMLGTNKVTHIGNYAFYKCSSVTNVTIPSSVRSIGKYAFSECQNLKDVLIPVSVTSIGDYAFSFCSRFGSMFVPTGVKALKNYTFLDCTNLTEVTLPYDMTSIGANAFKGCIRLKTACVPASFMGDGTLLGSAFPDRPSNMQVRYCGTNFMDGATWYYQIVRAYRGSSYDSFCELKHIKQGMPCVWPKPTGAFTVPYSVTTDGEPVKSIGEEAFMACRGLTDVNFAGPVTNIDAYAFRDCGGMQKFTIPDSVTGLGGAAFLNCSNLTSVTFGMALPRIKRHTFRACKSLRYVEVPDSVTGIEAYAFEGCVSLRVAYLPLALLGKLYETTVFSNCAEDLLVVYGYGTGKEIAAQIIDGYAWYYDVQSNVDGGRRLFKSKDAVPVSPAPSGYVRIPSTINGHPVTDLGYGFRGLSGITGIFVPDSVTTLGDLVFAGCAGLCEVSLPGALYGKVKDESLGYVPDLVVTYRGLTATVAFDSNGGAFSGADFGGMDGKSGTATLELNCCEPACSSGMKATKGGAAFEGWWTAMTGGTPQYDANGSCVPGEGCWNAAGRWNRTGNVKLYARFGGPHTLAFDSNGGVFASGNFGSMDGKSGTARVSVTCGKGAYNSGMRATLGGGKFLGWWTAKTGGSMQYDSTGKFVGNSTCWTASGKWRHHGNALLYARWESSGEPHNLKFDANGGVFAGANFGSMNGKSGTAQISVTCGKGSYNSGMRATRSGYTFQGWWTAASGGSMQYDANGKYVGGGHCWTSDGKWQHHGNAALYARWAADEPHTLKFDPNGGVLSGANFGSMDGKSGVAQVSVTCGKGSYSAGMRATKAGATFKGWWTAPTTGGSMQYDANGKFVPNSTCWDASGKWKHHGNATLYARWQ